MDFFLFFLFFIYFIIFFFVKVCFLGYRHLMYFKLVFKIQAILWVCIIIIYKGGMSNCLECGSNT